MFLIQEKLIKVESKQNSNNQMVHRLIFKHEQYDRGLDEVVPCSQAIKLADEHLDFLLEYQKLQGQVIAVPVVANAVDGNAYFKTFGEGKPFPLVTVTK